MPSTPTPNLRLELQVTGENANTWGTKNNTNLLLLENAITKRQTVALSNVDVTLSATNFADDQSRSLCLALTGTLLANVNVIVPAVSHAYLVDNQTTGSFTVTVKTPAGTGPTVGQGSILNLYCDGTNVKTILPGIKQTAQELTATVTPRDISYRASSVLRYGGLGDDTNNDALAAAIAATIASRHTIFDAGRVYRMVPTGTSPFYFGNVTGSLVYTGVLMTGSDHTVLGEVGSKLHIVSRPGVAGSDIQYCYASAKNLVAGTQSHIAFNGVTFDTQNDADAVNSNHRGVYLTGVDGVRLINTRSMSTGNRRGTAANLQNCRYVQILGHFNYKCTQAFNFRFTENLLVVGSIFHDFSEAIDHDGTQKRSVVMANCFSSTNRINQMWDINGQVEGVFVGATANNLGDIFTCQYKDTTPDNFSDYVNNVPVTTMTPSQRIVIGDISGSQLGSSSKSTGLIGNDWAGVPHAGFVSTHDIIVKNVQVADVGWWTVLEGERITLKNIYLEGVLTAASNYALNCSSQIGSASQREWSNLTVNIDNLYINGAERGGLRVQNAQWATINNVKVFGINSLGGSDFAIQLSGLTQRGAQISLDNVYIDQGNVNINGDSTTIATWAASTPYVKSQMVVNGGRFYRCRTSGTSAGAGGPTGLSRAITDNTVVWEYCSEPFSVLWGDNNRMLGDTNVQFAGDAHKYTHGRMYGAQLGDLAATGTVTRVLYTATRKCYVARAVIVLGATIAADAVNFRTFQFRSLTLLGTTTTLISTVNTTAGLTAFIQFDGGWANSEPGAWLEPGDTMYVDIPHSAAGKALSGLYIQFEVLEC